MCREKITGTREEKVEGSSRALPFGSKQRGPGSWRTSEGREGLQCSLDEGRLRRLEHVQSRERGRGVSGWRDPEVGGWQWQAEGLEKEQRGDLWMCKTSSWKVPPVLLFFFSQV